MTTRPDTGAEEGPSDEALIARWRGGDQRAATALVGRHAPAVARYAASLGVREAAEVEEVVQDTFVRAFGSLDRFRGESALRTWLFTIARRLVIDLRRSARRQGVQVEIEESHALSAHSALDLVVAVETEGRLKQALEALTPTQREVFVLRVSEGLSYREIAAAAETTEGAARVHYFNALRTIKELLDG